MLWRFLDRGKYRSNALYMINQFWMVWNENKNFSDLEE